MKESDRNKIQFDPFMKFVIEFHNASLSYNQLLNKVSENPKLFSENDICLLEEAFLVKHIAEWETFIQNILVYCVAIDTSQISKFLDLELPNKISFDNSAAIINGLSYLSITSSSELKGIAKKTISEKNNPFDQFQMKLLNQIDEAYALRNYVAHKSRKSKSGLLKMYSNRYSIDKFVSPGKFLSERIKDEVGEYPRSHLYYGKFMTMATLIWRHLDRKSYNFVFEDEMSTDGWLKGMVKMNKVFEVMTKEYNL
ncbi:hypothetical protein [Pararhodonellum marinum]|uniref:hypothetical protein n=1 Tax=Pararhodonellum marinum TaxID=2755358 RepID=UPI00188F4623|nr:hypothetical protein [Pararhodonellum marinum]